MKQRVLTAALLIPPVLLAVFLSNPLPVFALALVALAIGYVELAKLFGSKPGVPVLGLIGALVLSLQFLVHDTMEALRGARYFSELGKQVFPVGACALGALGCLGCWLVIRGRRGFLVNEIASLWLIAGLAGLVELKLLDTPARSVWAWDAPLLFALVPLWIGDTLAIFAGKAFGKHPLAPKISPKKTVEGAIANLIGCVGSAIGLAALIHQPILVGILAGLATGVLGQLGDLLESAMKRSAGVKDSGNLLPGHGGLLDRIDSILMSAPVVAFIVVSLGSK